MLMDLIKQRHSIRKYTDQQISREDLETILEAGNYAPNAGGGQRSMMVGIKNKELAAETFDNSRRKELMRLWEVSENYSAVCFVILGYIDGEQPHTKPRKPGRVKIVE